MAKPWLTGEKIMDRYGLAAAELGRLCHEGRLIAYLPEIVKPIYDLSTIEKIPKYPSIWVSSDKHIQIGETVRWDWEIILGVDKLRQELREIENELKGVAIALIENCDRSFFRESLPQYPFYRYNTFDHDFKDLDFNSLHVNDFPREMNSHIDDQIKILRDKKKRFAEKRRELRDDIRQLTIIPYRMRQELGPELTNEKIWLEIMPTAYRFLVEGRKMDENDLPGQLFFFDYDMFYRLEKSYKPSKEIHEIIAAYKIRLEAMWFERASVETVLGIPEQPGTTSNIPERPKESPDVQTVNQPPAASDKNQEISKKRPRKQLTVTERKEILARLGLKKSEKTIQRWDKGEGTPEGYDGYADAVKFGLWAQNYKSKLILKKALKGAKNPILIDSIDDLADDKDDD